MPKNLCPFDLERRPCMEHDCALYVQLQYQNDQGEQRSDWMCAVVAQVKLQFSGVVETARVQASIDKTATEVRQAGQALLSLPRRLALAANGDVDAVR